MSLADTLPTLGEWLAAIGVSIGGAASVSLILYVLDAKTHAYRAILGTSPFFDIPPEGYYLLFTSLIVLGAGLACVGGLLYYAAGDGADRG